MIKFGNLLQLCVIGACCSVRMVFQPHQCPGVAGKVCKYVLLYKDENPHSLCNYCRGEVCSVVDRCHDWTDEMWSKVNVYHEK